MRAKDAILLTAFSLFFGWFIVNSKPTVKDPLAWGEMMLQDTSTYIDTTQPLDVKSKTALFIGDSHTANFARGWQKQLSDSVGFIMKNASVSGKTTYWMLEMGVYKIDQGIDYCFVYGGANDMYTTTITPQEAVDNIKGIARMCTKRGIKCIILTGFDPVKCTRTTNPNYANKYAIFQQLLLTQYMEGAQVVDTRVVDRRDCWDDLCHMNPEGHRKIANQVIKVCKFKKI